jgi:hypothetical protein
VTFSASFRCLARAQLVASFALLSGGCFTENYHAHVANGRRIVRAQGDVDSLEPSAVLTRWRATNARNEQHTGIYRFHVRTEEGPCSKLTLFVADVSGPVLLSSKDSFTQPFRDQAVPTVASQMLTARAIAEAHQSIAGGVAEEGCRVILVAGRRTSDGRAVLAAFPNATPADVPLASRLPAPGELAIYPLVVVLDLVTLPFQLPIWLFAWFFSGLE